MNLKNPANFRRTLAAVGLILGPLALLVAAAVEADSPDGDDGAHLPRQRGGERGPGRSRHDLFIIGFTALLAGVIGIVHMIRERGVVLAHIAGVLAAVGLVFFVALVTTSLYDLSLAENAARAEAVKAYDGVEDYTVAYVILIPALLGTMIGLTLLTVAGVARALRAGVGSRRGLRRVHRRHGGRRQQGDQHRRRRPAARRLRLHGREAVRPDRRRVGAVLRTAPPAPATEVPSAVAR